MDKSLDMHNEKILSFCIPTFNRAEILSECLADLIPKIEEWNFEIIVSDNNSSDNTEEVVKSFQSQYSKLRYIRQNVSSDPDKNFADVLSSSTSCYTWLIGDSYRVLEKEINPLLKLMERDRYALIVVNSFNQVKDINTKVYTNSSQFLDDLGWYLPIMSAYIYRKDLLDQANYKKYYGSNFLQMGITFEYLENNVFEVLWYGENGFGATTLPKKSWHYEAFNVFAKNWVEFVLSLPRSIELSVKLNCIKKHGLNYGVFSIKSLLFLRQNNWLNYRVIKKYEIYLKYVTTPPLFIVLIISVMPKRLITLILNFRKKIFAY